MNRKIWMAGFLTAALIGAAIGVYAQDDPAPAGGDSPAMGQGMDGGMMGGGWIDKAKEKLGLTDDQASKLKDLFKSQMEANKPLRDQMKIDMDTLQQKVDLKASDADVKKLLDKLDGEQKEMQTAHEKMKDQLRSILSPTQQAKMVLGMRKMGMGMMEHWKGHHGWKKEGKDGGPKGGDGDSQPTSGNGTMNN